MLTPWHPVTQGLVGIPRIGSIRTDTPLDRQKMGAKVWTMYLEE